MDDAQMPPRIPPRLKSAPKIRQFYWCDFPEDAQLPEFWKRRPVIILSYRSTLHGTATVVPCSSKEQSTNRWAFPLESSVDGKAGFAICDKITTVAVSRLVQDKDGIHRMPADQFQNMLKLVLEWLPKL